MHGAIDILKAGRFNRSVIIRQGLTLMQRRARG